MKDEDRYDVDDDDWEWDDENGYSYGARANGEPPGRDDPVGSLRAGSAGRSGGRPIRGSAVDGELCPPARDHDSGIPCASVPGLGDDREPLRDLALALRPGPE